jgi:hypothetical protein
MPPRMTEFGTGLEHFNSFVLVHAGGSPLGCFGSWREFVLLR